MKYGLNLKGSKLDTYDAHVNKVALQKAVWEFMEIIIAEQNNKHTIHFDNTEEAKNVKI